MGANMPVQRLNVHYGLKIPAPRSNLIGMRKTALIISAALCLFWAVPVAHAAATERPRARPAENPRMSWEHQAGATLWTKTALSAMRAHGRPLTRIVPDDVANWCPAYANAPPDIRAQFWVGLISALSRYESTWKETAVGGGGKWYGLMQILPATARGYGCRASTGAALKDGTENLSCAIRIMAVTVPRDGVIARRASRWRGVAADWGPMTSASKRKAIANYTRRQSYCRLLSSVRPRPRAAPKLSNDG